MGTNNDAPTLMLNALPKGISVPNGFFASNIDDKKALKGTINPQPNISSLAPSLKIGSKIKIDFLYVGEKRWITKLSLDSDPNENSTSFINCGVKTFKTNSNEICALSASIGKLNWNFVVPKVKNNQSLIADPELLKKIKQIPVGSKINLDYETVNYAFVLKDVRMSK